MFPLRKLFSSQYLTYLWLGLSLLSFLSFGLYHLGKFETSDEHLWLNDPEYGRVHRYWNALKDHNWDRTYINDKPGITTALVAGPGFLIDKHPNEKMIWMENSARTFNPPYMKHVFFFFRLPFLFLNAFLILTLFFLIRYFTEDDLVALLSAMLMYLSPILVGMSQIVNPDTTLWSLVAVALFSYLNYLKSFKPRFIWIALFTGGFALLSKYSALVLFVFLYTLTFAHVFFHHTGWKDWFHHTIQRTLIGYLLFCIGSVLIFILFIPALITNPTLYTDGTIGLVKYSRAFFPYFFWLLSLYVLVMLDTVWTKSRWFLSILKKFDFLRPFLLLVFPMLVLLLLVSTYIVWTSDTQFGLVNISYDDAKSPVFPTLTLLNRFLLEARPITFTMTPIMLIGVIAALLRVCFHKPAARHQFLIFVLSAFILTFYIAVIAQNILVHTRYSIMLYPIMAVLGAIGWAELIRYLRAVRFMGFAILSIFITSWVILFNVRPFYFNYLSALLPESSSLTSSWGFGGYEAAQYLNALPHAKDLVIWTDYSGTCSFFVGRCVKADVINNWYLKNPGQFIDYAVVTRRGLAENKTYWDKIRRVQPTTQKPVWQFFINGRTDNFIKIYQTNPPTPVDQK